MLSYNELKPKKYIIYTDEPWEVIDAQVSRKQQNKPVNKTRLRNLISGRVVDQTFHVSDKIVEADISKRTLTYLYSNPKNNELWFSETADPKNRFTLPENIVGESIKYITEKTELESLVFTDKDGEDHIIGINYPMKVELKVTEAPPSIKGNTATGGDKVVTLETGATTTAPLFISTGDIIRISTETGAYSERVEKA